jgi:uncharacterized membrane protein
MRKLAHSLLDAALLPGQTFSKIVPGALPLSVASALLYFAVFGLLHRPDLLLAALSGQIALGVFSASSMTVNIDIKDFSWSSFCFSTGFSSNH